MRSPKGWWQAQVAATTPVYVLGLFLLMVLTVVLCMLLVIGTGVLAYSIITEGAGTVARYALVAAAAFGTGVIVGRRSR